MIVPRAIAHAIARGAKTEMRRPLSAGRFTRPRQPVEYTRPRSYEDAPARHAEDKTVTQTVCHVLILSQDEATLGAMTEDDARAEGFTAGHGLTALHRYRLDWEARHDDWKLTRRIWVVRFKVDTSERLLYLARVGGYTESEHLAIDDLPVVPPSQLGAVNDRRAKGLDRGAQEELQRREARRRLERLRELEPRARVRSIDLSREFEALDNLLDDMHQRLREG